MGEDQILTENSIPNYTDFANLYSDVSDVTDGQKTILRHGYVQCISKTLSVDGTPFIRLFINGTQVYEGFGNSGRYQYLWSPLFRVKTGDIIKYTITTESSSGCEKSVRLYKQSF